MSAARHVCDLIQPIQPAGLVWALFMRRHSGLIEIFGGNRLPGNRHYHNIASLADLHYEEALIHSISTNDWTLVCQKRHVEELYRKIVDVGDLVRSKREPLLT